MRNEKIDLLRFIGLSAIILAHVKPPDFVLQIRNFDVPLMVLIAGIVFNYSKRKEVTYKEYVLARIPRLCLPVWLFLTFLFVSLYLFSHFFQIDYPFSFKKILTSYTLLSGIGYVWIIRVFVLVTLIAPLIRSFSAKIKNNTAYLLLILLTLLIYSSVMPWLSAFGVIKVTLLDLVPYACVFALGMRLERLAKDKILLIAALNVLVFSGFALWFWVTEHKFVGTQLYKYPPHLYYLSYAIAISLLAYIAADSLLKWVKSMKLQNVVLFVGRNSMWIYLWHIFAIRIKLLFELQFSSFISFYLFVYGLAILFTVVQRYLVNQTIQYYGIAERNKKFILSVLTG